MSEKVSAGVDLDALEREITVGKQYGAQLIEHAPVLALIAELRAARAVVETGRKAAENRGPRSPLRLALDLYDRLTGERQ